MAALQFLFRERDAEDAPGFKEEARWHQKTHRRSPFRLNLTGSQERSDAAGAHPLNGITRNLPRIIEP